jgi:hypothetical protein
MDALKRKLEKSLQCYEECRTELRGVIVQNATHLIQIQTRDALLAELKKVKGELENTLEKNEAYCHQWELQLASTYHRGLELYGGETQKFKVTNNIASYYLWMNCELKLFPDTMSKVGDYRAATCSKTIFHLLEERAVNILRLLVLMDSSSLLQTPCQPQAKLSMLLLRLFFAISR